VKLTGATVHFTDEGVDAGMILAQRAVPVLRGDTPETLRDRVLAVEHELLVYTVKALTENRVSINDGKAWILEQEGLEQLNNIYKTL
jgi:phosphoribosylglycinamide formyltransferase-1